MGAVAVTRRTSYAERYLKTSVRRVIVASLAIATAAGILIMTLGVFLIGRPLARVVDVARRAGLHPPRGCATRGRERVSP